MRRDMIVPLERMEDGYVPPMSDTEALELYEEALSSLHTQVKTVAANAWDQLPEDPDERKKWLEKIILSVDQQWGQLSDVIGSEFVINHRSANGYAPGAVVHSQPVSALAAEYQRAEIMKALEDGSEADAYALFERRMVSMVLNRSRKVVTASAAKAGTAWCRVPERGACWFCLMLASRGAVYHSKHTASRTADGQRYHAHCRCTVSEVLGDKLPKRTQACVDWYDEHGSFQRDDVESGAFSRSTGIPSASTIEMADKRLGRSKVPEGWTPNHLDERVSRDEWPVPTDEDLDVICNGRGFPFESSPRPTRAQGGHLSGSGTPGKTEFPASWTDTDIEQAMLWVMSDPQYTSLEGDRRVYRRDVHGVIVEASWFPSNDAGTPRIAHCYPRCGEGVTRNSSDGVAVPQPYNLRWLETTMGT